MIKLQTENEYYILYSPDSLKYITDSMENILLESFDKYKEIFNVDEYRQIQINFFDNIEDFRNYILSMRDDKESLPSYAKGTFDNGMINAFIESNISINSEEYNRKLYMASHELFHIMYLELILNNDYSKRITWFDEGMAQYLSGEKDYLKDKTKFRTFIEKVIKKTKYIPNLNSLSHGANFCDDKYNGYDLSFIAVKYIIEVLHKDKIYYLLSDFDKILDYGNNVIVNALQYYKEIISSQL